MELQFAAQSYRARSAPLAAQRCVNMFVERSPALAKTRVPVFMFPGLDEFARFGTGPINGLHIMATAGVSGSTVAVSNERLFALSGGALYEITEDGLAVLIGQTNLGGLVSMADNRVQMAMVDGEVGWVYQPGGLNQVTLATAASGATSIVAATIGTLEVGATIKIPLDNGLTHTTTIAPGGSGPAWNRTIPLAAALPGTVTLGAKAYLPSVVLGQITAPAFQPADTVVYFDSYFVFNAHNSNQFFISASQDGTQYDGNDFASAEANPDSLLAVINYHEQLLLCGTRSIEVWYDAGAANFPFQRFDGAFIHRGLAASLAIVQEDNTVFWLGEDGIFYRLDGYAPRRISTFGTETAWQSYPTYNDATAFVITIEGHKFIFVDFPSGNATWCYDISSGVEEPLWYERVSSGEKWV